MRSRTWYPGSETQDPGPEPKTRNPRSKTQGLGSILNVVWAFLVQIISFYSIDLGAVSTLDK